MNEFITKHSNPAYSNAEIFDIEDIPKPGTIILSPNSIPWSDPIATGQGSMLDIDRLADYLNFLELVVLYEELFIGCYDFQSKLSITEINETNLLEHLGNFWRVQGDYEIKKYTEDELESRNILKYHKLISKSKDTNYLLPEVITEKYLNISPAINQVFKNDVNKAEKVPIEARENYVLTNFTVNYGFGISLGEFARKAKVPYYLSPWENACLEESENLEQHISLSSIDFFRKHLNKGAFEKITNLNIPSRNIIMPSTPIACQIINEANSPEDLLKVALQLRDNNKNFRKEIIEIETMIMDGKMSIEEIEKYEKNKEKLADKFWQDKGEGYHKILKSISGFINLVGVGIKIVTSNDYLSLPKLILDSNPYDVILNAYSSRKVKVFLQSKKAFLKGKDWESKIKKIFKRNENCKLIKWPF